MIENEQSGTVSCKSEDQLYLELADLIYDIYEEVREESLDD